MYVYLYFYFLYQNFETFFIFILNLDPNETNTQVLQAVNPFIQIHYTLDVIIFDI